MTHRRSIMTDQQNDPPAATESGPSWFIRYRLPATWLLYALSFAIALFGAFGLAYNFHRMGHWVGALYLPLAALAIPIKLLVFGWMKQYRGSWRYVGLHDIFGILRV